MNTIKFAPYNELITEQHNIETAQVEDHIVDGTAYKFYSPCNFNIFVTNACPNSCYFCINKNASEICSDKEYFDGLKKSLETLKNVDVEFTITGGEPTLNKERFVKTLKILKEYGIKERTISTTGFNLLESYDGKYLIQHLLENGFIHNISISRMSFDENRNNEIFGSKNISNEELSKLAYFAKMNDAELRVSTNLMDCSIRTYSDILKFVDDNGIGSAESRIDLINRSAVHNIYGYKAVFNHNMEIFSAGYNNEYIPNTKVLKSFCKDYKSKNEIKPLNEYLFYAKQTQRGEDLTTVKKVNYTIFAKSKKEAYAKFLEKVDKHNNEVRHQWYPGWEGRPYQDARPISEGRLVAKAVKNSI